MTVCALRAPGGPLRGEAIVRMIIGVGRRSARRTRVEHEAPAALATKKTVYELVATFQEAERTIRAAFAALVKAEADLNAAFTLGSHHTIHIPASRYSNDAAFERPDDAIERITRDAWETIVERLELRRVMSIRRYEELQTQLRKGELPPITEENVRAFAAQHAAQFSDLFNEAVVEVFEWLRPAGSAHKTNSMLEIGPKVVLEYMVEQWSGSVFHVRVSRRQHLIALERVFEVLDGQGHTGKGHFSVLQAAVEASTSRRAETPYFYAKWFRIGTLHLKFKRLDLLMQFNQIAGGKRFRPHQEDLGEDH